MSLENLDEFFFWTDDELLKEASRDDEYRDLKREAEKIRGKFPIIDELMESANWKHPCQLTPEERRAIGRYMEIRRNMKNCMERKYYFRGHRDCLKYLMECGMLE
jgi:hypothetical protein